MTLANTNINSFPVSDGFAFNHLYRVTILPPITKSMNSFLSSEKLGSMSYYAHSVMLAGVSLNAENNRRHGVGASELMPLSPLFQNKMQITFYLDSNYNGLNVIQKWLSYIGGWDYKDGIATKNVNGGMPYEMQYKENYESKMLIEMINNNGKLVKKYHIEGCFPLSILDLPLNYSRASITEMTVDFAYKYWRTEESTQSTSSTIKLPSSNTTQSNTIPFEIIQT